MRAGLGAHLALVPGIADTPADAPHAALARPRKIVIEQDAAGTELVEALVVIVGDVIAHRSGLDPEGEGGGCVPDPHQASE